MAFSVSYIYEIQDKYTSKLLKIHTQTKKFRNNITLTQRKMRGLSSTLTNLQHKMFSVSSRGQTLFPTHKVHEFKRAIGGVNSSIARTNRTMDRTNLKLNKVNNKFAKFKRMGGMGGAVSGIALGAGTLFPVKKASDFESVMADVRKVIREITPEQLVELRKQIKGSAIDMARLPAQTARIAEAAGKLNIPVNQMGQFIGLVSRSAVAFDVLEETIGTDVGRIKTRLKLTIEGTESLMDSINFLADNTSAQGSRMINIIGRISGVMNTIEMPTELVAGWAAFADQVEVTPMLAASGFRMVVTKMKKMPGMMEHLLKAPSETIIKFLRQFEKIEPAKRAVVLLKVFGDEAGKFAEKAVNNLELLDKTLALVSDNSEAAGSMMRELQWKMGTAAFKTKQAWSAVTIMFIEIGNSMLPLVKVGAPIIIKIAQFIGDLAKKHPQITKIVLSLSLIAAALTTVLIGFGAIAASIAFLIPAFTAVGTAISVVVTGLTYIVAIGGLITMILGAPLTILLALIAAVVVLHKKFGILNEPIRMFKDLLEQIKQIDFIQSIQAGLEYAKNFVGIGTNIVSQKEIVSHGSLNGEIVVSASEGSEVEDANMFTSQPGNLGFNMGRSH